jgi:hypothetical protein
VHGEQNTPVDRLQAVSGIGQGTRHDHAHGVIKVGGAHLRINVNGLDIASICGEYYIVFSHKISLKWSKLRRIGIKRHEDGEKLRVRIR